MRGALAALLLCAVLPAVAGAQGGPPPGAVQRNLRGVELVKQGKLPEAIEQFRQAVETDPGYVTALMNLGHAYDLHGDTDEAIARYRTVLDREPDNALAHNNLAVLYDRKGLHEEAIRELQHVLERDPTNAAATKNLEATTRNQTIAREREQQIDRAMKEFEAHPDDPHAAYRVARIQALHGQTDEALTWVIKALDLGFDDFEYLAVDPVLAPVRKDPRFAPLLKR
jgi:tetratricopeptide (TPR) repeat protein